MEETQLTFWFLQKPHSEVETIKKDLLKYTQRFVLALERCKGAHKETNGEHYHIAAEIDQEEYNRYKQNIYQKQYKLRGKAIDGKPKQYGKIEKVRDQTKMLAYTIKDMNLVLNGITLEELQQSIDVSYPKTETWEQQIIDALKAQDNDDRITLGNIEAKVMELEILVLNHYLVYSTTLAVPSRAFMKKIIIRYLMYFRKVDVTIIRYLI